MSLIAQLTRHKSIEQLQAELGTRKDFRRVLGLWQLTAIGLGGQHLSVFPALDLVIAHETHGLVSGHFNLSGSNSPPLAA